MTIAETEQSRFQQSNSACARALAADTSLSIDTESSSHAVRLGFSPPSLSQIDEKTRKNLARGISDVIALVAAHHNPEIHQLLQPAGSLSQTLFNEMERARCEAMYTGKYRGVDSNLGMVWQETQHANWRAHADPGEQLRQITAHMVRKSLKLPARADQRINDTLDHWRESGFVNNQSLWTSLRDHIKDQYQFAATSLQIIALIDRVATGDVDNANSVETTEHKASDETDQSTDTEETDTEEPDNEDPDGTLTVELRDDTDISAESLLAPADDTPDEEAVIANRDAPVSADSENAGGIATLATSGYRVYSRAEDEIVTAKSLCTQQELDFLRNALDDQIKRHARTVGRLSGRLQRVLMAQQNRHWKFDLDEGILDTTRLTRVVTDPMAGLSFKAESDIEFKNTTVTLLVDNSKSMLGKPIAIAAACADLLSQTLERCGVTVEILGFTTTQLHGGEILEDWKHQGATDSPGRLNGLRHIIYKAADTPYRAARKSFGLMLHKELLKQNIDGEALLWAHQRLLKRPEQRKILMVISDGAPIDTSTMMANPKNYLVDHLHQVIGHIEKQSTVELLAIGIGHDVTQYYQRAMRILDARDLSKSMLTHLGSLFAKAD